MSKKRYGKNKSSLTRVLVMLAGLLVVAVILSAFADQYWAFDLFSHFVVQYALASAFFIFFFLLSKRLGWVVVMSAVLASQLYQLAPLFTKQGPGIGRYDTVKVLQYNVNRNNKNVDEMARWIISQSEDVDIVVLLEVTDMWQESIRRIKWAYPYHTGKDMRGGRNMVVFSRLYIDEMEIKYVGEANEPIIVLRGETTGYEQPFVLYGAHPPPPIFPSYAKRRNGILDSIGKNVAQETVDHKMVIADLNTTRFSPYFKELTEKSGLKDSNEGLGFKALNGTWPKTFSKYMGITIDNVLVSDGIKVEKKELGPAMGSDHFPVMTTLKFIVPEAWGNS